jgi:hypothetical protein
MTAPDPIDATELYERGGEHDIAGGEIQLVGADNSIQRRRVVWPGLVG